MPKKRIAIIGAGNAGCITALHFYFHGRDRFEIEIYHSPEKHPIERVVHLSLVFYMKDGVSLKMNFFILSQCTICQHIMFLKSYQMPY